MTPGEYAALVLSLKNGLFCMVLSLPPALATGWLLARKEFPGKTLLDGLVHLPLVMPPVTSGYLLLLAFSKTSPLGGFIYMITGRQVSFSFTAAVVASMFVSFPLFVRSIRTALSMIDRRIEEAAMLLGKSPARVFTTVTLPLALPGIISGGLLCFARSLGEFGATMTFAGNISGVTRTLPLAIYSFMQIPGQESSAMKLVIFSLFISLGAFFAGEFLERRALYAA